jgi:catechol 2,3-dioxygenase-like lactoylglutathione lyase family enzyme
MKLESAYPLIVTDELAACRAFYVDGLGFEVVFEASWFVYMKGPGESPFGIAFMTPDHPSQPPGPARFGGEGLLFTLQVADAAEEYERIRAAGLEIAHPLTAEPWGQLRFGLLDPARTWVDVVEQTEPEAGFWERYPAG